MNAQTLRLTLAAACGLSIGLGACAGAQSYRVTRIQKWSLPGEIEVKALGGRTPGYSVKLSNTTTDVLEVNWADAHLQTDDGWEVPLRTTPVSRLGKIYPGGRVEYHLEPVHGYAPKNPASRGDLRPHREDAWKPWPAIEQHIIVPVRVVQLGSCGESCPWDLARVTVTQVAIEATSTEEGERWRASDSDDSSLGDPVYDGPDSSDSPDIFFEMALGLRMTYGETDFPDPSPMCDLEFGLDFDAKLGELFLLGADFTGSKGDNTDGEEMATWNLGLRPGIYFDIPDLRLSLAVYGRVAGVSARYTDSYEYYDFNTDSYEYYDDVDSWTGLSLGLGLKLLFDLPWDLRATVGVETMVLSTRLDGDGDNPDGAPRLLLGASYVF
jgi:hypothetical protein